MVTVCRANRTVYLFSLYWHLLAGSTSSHQRPLRTNLHIHSKTFFTIDHDIFITTVVADRVLTSSKVEVSDIIQMLSSVAADMNLMKVVVQLGQARDMGSFPNPLADIDEVRPVLRAKVSDPRKPKSYFNLTKIYLLAVWCRNQEVWGWYHKNLHERTGSVRLNSTMWCDRVSAGHRNPGKIF